MEYILIFISAIFVNNIVLAQFLGICPFLGVSRKIGTSLGMSAAVAFVMVLATLVTWLVQTFVLVPAQLEYMQTIVFILVIASLVQMVEIVLKKLSPTLYQALGIFLPLIDSERDEPGRESGLCPRHRYRFRPGADGLCRHPRAAGADQYPQRYARHGHRAGHSWSAELGIHGFLGC